MAIFSSNAEKWYCLKLCGNVIISFQDSLMNKKLKRTAFI